MRIWIGYEPREHNAYAVAVASIRRYWPEAPVQPLILDRLRQARLYTRPIGRVKGRMWDPISDAPMSTEFAISRFLVPTLACHEGWALFMDCDMLVRTDLRELLGLADESKAVQCVQHKHLPSGEKKMDRQIQTAYRRKNWSSVMLFNCSHPSNRILDSEMVNTVPGRDLHGFCWLSDSEIGTLGPEWNYLVGETEGVQDPKIVHFTNGIPSMPGYEDSEYAEEWRSLLWQGLVNA